MILWFYTFLACDKKMFQLPYCILKVLHYAEFTLQIQLDVSPACQ